MPSTKEWNSGILSQILEHHRKSSENSKTCIDKSVSWFQSKALHFCTSSHVEAHGLTWHWHHIWCMKHPRVAVHLRREPFPSLDFVGFGAWQECYISMSLHPTGKCRKWTSTQSSCSPSIGNLGFWRGLWEDLKTWNKAALVIACFILFCCVSCCFTSLLQQREEDVSDASNSNIFYKSCDVARTPVNHQQLHRRLKDLVVDSFCFWLDRNAISVHTML